ncbi:MAG: hypothetical protein H6740_25235 [Alphaproteobacteria bacterium]|nr:hypothetical protein [Alphaproteobacteria bacterium]
MACEPDADRLGVVARHAGGFRFFNGSEMGALVARCVLTHGAHPGPGQPILMKTEVTSSLISGWAVTTAPRSSTTCSWASSTSPTACAPWRPRAASSRGRHG